MITVSIFNNVLVSLVYLLLYIDGMLIASEDKPLINNLKYQLSDMFKVKNLRAVKKIFGIEIKRDQKASIIYLSQMKYLEKVLDRFNMSNYKHVSNPLATRF